MTIDPTPSFDHRHYLIERFGLSPEECEIIFTYMNGIMPYLGGPPSETYLRDELLGAAYWSAQEHAKFGQDLSSPRNDSPEMPRLIKALAEKVGEFAPWQQAGIAFYAFGFWGGISAAEREQEEKAALRNAVPSGWDKV